MDKKSKLILALLLFIIALLALFVGFISYKVATIENNIHTLVSQEPLQPKVVHGIDGKDGQSIVGPQGISGKDGVNSISNNTVVEKVFYTSVPGPEGKPGKDAIIDKQYIQLNPVTKDLETKSDSDSFWTTMIRCSELLRVCPGEIVTEVTGVK